MAGERKCIANLARLDALMDEAGLDGWCCARARTSPTSRAWCTRGRSQRHVDLTDSTRPVMLVWPRNGKPVIVANKIAAGLAQRDGWIEDIVLYEAYVDSPQEKLARSLRDTQLASAQGGLREGLLQRRALGGDPAGRCQA